MACLWRAGYAITDPGYSFYHPELRMFDPVSQEGRQLLYAFTEGLSGGCDASCQVNHLRLLLQRLHVTRPHYCDYDACLHTYPKHLALQSSDTAAMTSRQLSLHCAYTVALCLCEAQSYIFA